MEVKSVFRIPSHGDWRRWPAAFGLDGSAKRRATARG